MGGHDEGAAETPAPQGTIPGGAGVAESAPRPPADSAAAPSAPVGAAPAPGAPQTPADSAAAPGAPGGAAAAPGVVARTSGSRTPPAGAPVAALPARAELHLLQRSDGTGLPMFCQFNSHYARSPMLVQNTPDRTISSSGCGLCALCSYLAAAGCKEMRYDASSRTFTAGTAPLNPRTFNEYLTHYSAQHDLVVTGGSHHAIYAADPEGALRDTAHATWDAIDRLVELSQGLAENSFHGFSSVANPLHGVSGRLGRDIPELTAWLDAGKPAILGVAFTRPPGTHRGLHQVLAVGYGRQGTSTYYVILDSGWSNCRCPYDALDSGSHSRAAFTGRENPVLAQELLRCAVAPENNPGAMSPPRTYQEIFMWKALGGLEQYTSLQMHV